MSCKLTRALLLLCVCGVVLQTCEAIIFTLGGLVLDSALAFLVFGKFLSFPLFLGKRSVESPLPLGTGPSATPEQYLAVAASIDTNKCLPLAVCAAMAKSRDPKTTRSEFDNLVIETFQRKLKQSQFFVDKSSPMNYYLEAAQFGQKIGVVESCRLVSPTCNYTMDELQQLTSAVSQYQL